MRTLWILIATALATAGCAGGDGLKVPPLHSVSGLVTLDDKPLASAQVMFLPKAGTKNVQIASASTGEDGKFTLKYPNGKEGCPTGEYSIFVSKLLTADGKPIPEGQTAADVAAVDIIPARYKDPEAPMNGINITGPNDSVALKLKSK